MTLLYTNAAGISSNLTTDADVQTLLTQVKIQCNQYADSGDVASLIQAKTYADSLASTIASELAVSLPTDATINTETLKLKVNSKIVEFRDKSYIDALAAASKTYTLQKVTEMQTVLNALVVAETQQALTNAKLYTDSEINLLKATLTSTYATVVYVDNKLLTINEQLANLEELINDAQTSIFSFEKFLEYLNQASDVIYPNRLNSTINVDGKIQRFHFKGFKEAILEVHNVEPITPWQPSETTFVQKDSLANGALWKHVGHFSPEFNYYGLFIIKNNVISEEPVIKINENTGIVFFGADGTNTNVEVGYAKNSIYDKAGYSDIATAWDVINYCPSIGATMLYPRGGLGNWLLCDGSSFNITDYSELAAILELSGMQSGILPSIASPHNNLQWYIKAL